MIDVHPITTLEGISSTDATDGSSPYLPRQNYHLTVRKRLECASSQSDLLLQAITQAQLRFLGGCAPETIFSTLLCALLKLTNGCHAYLHTVPADGLDSSAITVCQSSGHEADAETRNRLESLAAQVLASGQVYVWQSLPDVVATSYLGLPITITNSETAGYPATCTTKTLHGTKTIGSIALATGMTGMEPNFIDQVQPLLATCANILISHHNTMRLRQTEAALAELGRAHDELVRMSRDKEEFLATINHELRTPLNAVMLHAESLQTQLLGTLNVRQQRAVDSIIDSSQHLLLLINDTLDLAKMDAGMLRLDIRTASVHRICHSALGLVSELARRKQIEIELSCDESVLEMDVDERRLKQMLVNLLSNAIKFTPDVGRVGLEVKGHLQDNCVTFTVWDTGIGIAHADLQKLFQPFMQLDNDCASQHGGTGLGLFLVHRMAQLHGGSVSVTSAPGQGSRFAITLPWRQHGITQIA
jgi:signal transduction histidine kinase